MTEAHKFGDVQKDIFESNFGERTVDELAAKYGCATPEKKKHKKYASNEIQIPGVHITQPTTASKSYIIFQDSKSPDMIPTHSSRLIGCLIGKTMNFHYANELIKKGNLRITGRIRKYTGTSTEFFATKLELMVDDKYRTIATGNDCI
ncbi:hypothetical protein HOK51_01075 [Candidatus Woesearchaeota archaeon]|jgi:hypothetical protein|nr:hypothetical protein [Candidatus Woesearchaeota archaeon]MBT6518407.1 hypothetical protein [Candidatus Woesearchaeota archaeon]MBT7366589.1 hypothetical protein [Candidatus Woesearchaeota archaeon]